MEEKTPPPSQPAKPEPPELPGITKATSDIYRHITTLCSAGIVVLAAFLGRPDAPTLDSVWLLGVATIGFGFCIVLGVGGMSLAVKEWQQAVKANAAWGDYLKEAKLPVEEAPEIIHTMSDYLRVIEIWSEWPQLGGRLLRWVRLHEIVRTALFACFTISMMALMLFVLCNLPFAPPLAP